MYVFSDLHGNYNLWLKIKNYLKENNSRAACLGDCIDRGQDGLKILEEVIASPDISLLKGNHEEFLEKYLKSEIEYGYPEIDNTYTWMNNGGGPTSRALEEYSTPEKEELYKILKNLPLATTYENENNQTILLSHAGLSPQISDREHELRGRGDHLERLLWDRKHFNDIWDNENYSNVYVVHGHTPVQYLPYFSNISLGFSADKPQVVKYAEGHKIDIDLCAPATGTAALLNLDTFEPIYFYDDTFVKKEIK